MNNADQTIVPVWQEPRAVALHAEGTFHTENNEDTLCAEMFGVLEATAAREKGAWKTSVHLSAPAPPASI